MSNSLTVCQSVTKVYKGGKINLSGIPALVLKEETSILLSLSFKLNLKENQKSSRIFYCPPQSGKYKAQPTA